MSIMVAFSKAAIFIFYRNSFSISNTGKYRNDPGRSNYPFLFLQNYLLEYQIL